MTLMIRMLSVLVLTTSVAAADAPKPRLDHYVGANLVGPAFDDGMDHASDVSIEAGFRLGDTPLFGHVEAGTGAITANVGVELKLCTRGAFVVCGSGGIDAAYVEEEVEPIARATFELGTTLRVRMGAEAPMRLGTRRSASALDGAQLEVGLAYVF